MREPLIMSTPTKLVTADELLRMPDDGFRYELVEGRLVRMPLTGARHGIVSMRIAGELYQFVRHHGLGEVFAQDSGFKLASNPDTVRGPDVAFVRAERTQESGLPPGYWPGPPDLAVEVRSPSDRRADLEAKIQDYLRSGVRMVWLVEPDNRTLTIYRPAASAITLSGDQEVDGGDVVPGFRLPLRRLFED